MSSRNKIPLESIRVATPCKASWEKMQGDDAARFCQSCHKHVYNLSGMSHAQAESLIRSKEGELCVRFYQRADGTILTDDCPVGLKIVRRPFQWLAAGATLLLMWGAAIAHQPDGSNPPAERKSEFVKALKSIPLVAAVANYFAPPPPKKYELMGAMVASSLPPGILGSPAAPAPSGGDASGAPSCPVRERNGAAVS